MVKQASSFVLASISGSTYKYSTPLLSLRPCWVTYLTIPYSRY